MLQWLRPRRLRNHAPRSLPAQSESGRGCSWDAQTWSAASFRAPTRAPARYFATSSFFLAVLKSLWVADERGLRSKAGQLMPTSGGRTA